MYLRGRKYYVKIMVETIVMGEPSGIICGGNTYAHTGYVVWHSSDGSECDYWNTEKA